MQGGVAQGIGQALLENAVYDADGQLLSGSFMDYTMPRADDLPNIKVGTEITLCTHNPLGVKGCGEVGAIGSPPAVINALVDALKDYGVRHIDMPATRAEDSGRSSTRAVRRWRRNRQGKGNRTMYDFAYQKPGSLADAVKALAADADAKALAGGMTLIPVLKQRLTKPSAVVDLAKLGLAGITVAGNTVTIGAMTTHATVANSAEVKAKIPGAGGAGERISATRRCAIAAPSAAASPTTIRRRTIRPRLLALGATIKTNKRSIKADDFFTGMFSTALEQGEIITAVEFPVPEKAAYEKFRNPASRYAMVGVFVAKTGGGVRVAVTGAGQGGVFRHTDMEKALAANFSPDAVAGIVDAGRRTERRHPCQRRISRASGRRDGEAGGGEGGLRPRVSFLARIGHNGGPPLDPDPDDPHASWRLFAGSAR